MPGVTLGKALDDLHAIARRTLPAGVHTDLAGESREFAESSGGLNFLFLIALVFIYLVLAAQFESFIHPLTILLSVPLAVFGALVTLFIFRMSINIYSQIGLIMLIGLVTKNAILIVEFANQRRARGLSDQSTRWSSAAAHPAAADSHDHARHHLRHPADRDRPRAPAPSRASRSAWRWWAAWCSRRCSRWWWCRWSTRCSRALAGEPHRAAESEPAQPAAAGVGHVGEPAPGRIRP